MCTALGLEAVKVLVKEAMNLPISCHMSLTTAMHIQGSFPQLGTRIPGKGFQIKTALAQAHIDNEIGKIRALQTMRDDALGRTTSATFAFTRPVYNNDTLPAFFGKQFDMYLMLMYGMKSH